MSIKNVVTTKEWVEEDPYEGFAPTTYGENYLKREIAKGIHLPEAYNVNHKLNTSDEIGMTYKKIYYYFIVSPKGRVRKKWFRLGEAV